MNLGEPLSCQGPGPLSKVARGTPIPLAKGDNGDDITPLPSAAMILVKPTPPLLEGKPTPPVGSSLNSTPWKNSPTGYQFGRKRGIPKARGRTIGSSSRNIQKSSVVFAVIGLLVVYNLCSSLRQLNAVVQHAQSAMRSAIGEMELDDIFHNRNRLNDTVMGAVQEAAGSAWGSRCCDGVGAT